jgi:hypothetical protein
MLAGCTGIPADALRLGPESMADRKLQTRAFQRSQESDVIAACAGVLQDLGFTLDESETKLGVLVASREISAVNSFVVGTQVLLKLITLGTSEFKYAHRQVIRASLVVRPAASGQATVRVTFQRRIHDNDGLPIKAEQLNDARLYEEFFARLSQSVFLETQRL